MARFNASFGVALSLSLACACGVNEQECSTTKLAFSLVCPDLASVGQQNQFEKPSVIVAPVGGQWWLSELPIRSGLDDAETILGPSQVTEVRLTSDAGALLEATIDHRTTAISISVPAGAVAGDSFRVTTSEGGLNLELEVGVGPLAASEFSISVAAGLPRSSECEAICQEEGHVLPRSATVDVTHSGAAAVIQVFNAPDGDPRSLVVDSAVLPASVDAVTYSFAVTFPFEQTLAAPIEGFVRSVSLDDPARAPADRAFEIASVADGAAAAFDSATPICGEVSGPFCGD